MIVATQIPALTERMRAATLEAVAKQQAVEAAARTTGIDRMPERRGAAPERRAA